MRAPRGIPLPVALAVAALALALAWAGAHRGTPAAPHATLCPSPEARAAAGRALALARLREARGHLDRMDGADALAVDALLAEAIGELDPDATPPTEPTTP